jgi:putative two-component system response regulator
MSRIEKPSVLLVDDNEPTRTLITALLQREFDVHHAIDGHDAIEKLKTSAFSAILLDLRMPVIDGFGVLEFLEQNAAPMLKKTIIVTAALASREIDRAKAFGVWEIVRKPFDVETLVEAVRKCVGGESGKFSNVFCSSGPMLLLLADLLRQRLM